MKTGVRTGPGCSMVSRVDQKKISQVLWGRGPEGNLKGVLDTRNLGEKVEYRGESVESDILKRVVEIRLSNLAEKGRGSNVTVGRGDKNLDRGDPCRRRRGERKKAKKGGERALQRRLSTGRAMILSGQRSEIRLICASLQPGSHSQIQDTKNGKCARMRGRQAHREK